MVDDPLHYPPGTDWSVQGFTSYRGELVMYGQFHVVNGLPCEHVARWDGRHWRALGSPPLLNPQSAGALGDRLYVGDTTGAWGPFVFFPFDSPAAICDWRGEMYIAGNLSVQLEPSVYAMGLVRWNGSQFSRLDSALLESTRCCQRSRI